MPRQRNVVASYNISKHRYMELYHYCMQYQEWKEELKDMQGLRAHENTGGSNGKSDPTAQTAIRMAELDKRCKIIEDTATETDEQLAAYILAAVTREGNTYKYLSLQKKMPCGHNLFYKLRRKFYYLLSKKI